MLLAFSVLGTNVNIIFTILVGKISYPFFIRRPSGKDFSEARSISQISGISLFLRDGEDITPGAENCPFTRWGNIKTMDKIRYPFIGGSGQNQIAGDFDFDLFGVVCVKIQHVKVSPVFIDDIARTHAGPLDVIFVVIGDLFCLFGIDIIGEDIQGVIPIRVEIDHILMPHGGVVGSLPVGCLFDFVFFQIVDPHVLCCSAFVAFPGAKLPEPSIVS